MTWAGMKNAKILQRIGFGGGCHWCTEAVFQTLRGVETVEQGFIASSPPDESFSEAVIVSFNPEEIDLRSLIVAHVTTHSSTSNHKLRNKYRSAVYTFDDLQHDDVRNVLQALSVQCDTKFVTRALPYRAFKPSHEQYRNYYARDPAKPFCQNYIEPKITQLRQDLAHLVKDQG